ncbi:DUF433 domain-containing protein [Paenibacillus pini]|uniref:DUF433 domain-containing protein n=1 Tax=Paenibacillus pini JCM 16418 TaxID=1236976 RepID=W7YJ18_9BACL|nr:DUF433 domain-containing protein [Paenibacillus pini]GAF10900.1 hypothetical protein JCM16418_5134 [Paenibacillus pini JCM 16418]
MHIDDMDHLKDRISVWKLVDGYNHIGINIDVCGGEPTIVGTRIRPENICRYGTIKEIMEDFELTSDEVVEAIKFVESV